MATRFGKNHFDFLKVIKTKLKEADRASNFACTIPDERKAFFAANVFPGEIDIPGPKGAVRKSPMYYLTRDGFSFFVMGFTGRESDLWKIRFIQAFDALENHVRTEDEEQRPYTMHNGFTAGILWERLRRYAPERRRLILAAIRERAAGETQKAIAERHGVSVHVIRGVFRRFGAFRDLPNAAWIMEEMDALEQRLAKITNRPSLVEYPVRTLGQYRLL